MNLCNLSNVKREITLFTRDNKGVQHIEKINDWFPFFYETHEKGEHIGYDGTRLKKIYTSEPADISKQKSLSSFSADIKFVTNYLIHKVDKIEKTIIKAFYIDIEVIANEFPDPEKAKYPIACISIYNSFTKEVKTWYLGEWKDEIRMLEDFCSFVKRESPDLLCLSPETIIKTQNGFNYLKNLKIGDEILSLNIKNQIAKAKIIDIHKNSKETIKFYSKKDIIESSYEHLFPIFILNNFKLNNKYDILNLKKAKEIKIGDYFLNPINYLIDDNKRSDLHWFIGYYFADGTKGINEGLRVADENIELLKIAQNILEEINIKTTIAKYGINCYILLSDQSTQARNLKNKITENYKNLKNYLNSLSVGEQISLISGFIDGDGGYGDGHISLGTINEFFVDWCSYILWGLGIPNKKRINYPKNEQIFYHLSIERTNKNNIFYFKHPNKKEYLNLDDKYCHNTVPLYNVIKTILNTWDITLTTELSSEFYANTTNVKKKLAIEILQYILSFNLKRAKICFIKKLINYIENFYFNKIEKIEENGIKDTIEISLDKRFLFIGNNILTHNCGWNIKFDYTYLFKRIKDFPKKISPINSSRHGEDKNIYYPNGISIIDYMCLDKDTEILTHNGWKSYHNINYMDKALSYDLISEEMKEAKIENIFSYDYDGEMYYIHNRRTNQLLTPNHKTLILTKDSKKQYGVYKFCNPNQINSWMYLPMAPKNGYRDGFYKELSDNEVRLIGWILTEGSWYKNDRAIRIAQAKPNYVIEIENLLNELKLNYSKYTEKLKTSDFYNYLIKKMCHRNWPCSSFRLSTKESVKYKNILNNKKELNYNLLNLPLHQLKILFETLIKGDGTFIRKNNGNTIGVFYQKEGIFANQIQELALKCGYSISRSKLIGEPKYYKFHITKKWITGATTKIIPTKQYYKGKIWCINTNYGTLICRRNGQVFITGNSWDKKNTLGHRFSYALDNVVQEELKEKSWGKTDFTTLNIRVKEKNINDVIRLAKLEEKLKYIDYFDEIRCLTKCQFEDLYWNSRIVEMLLLEEAKLKNIILPNKVERNEETTFQGAIRDTEAKGIFEGVGRFDLTSAYPQMIVNFCLDSQNIEKEGININGILFKQNPDALIPCVVKKILKLKDEYKRTSKGTKKYAAIKSITNSTFGVLGNQHFRLFDLRIASSITYLVRDLLMYIKKRVEESGLRVIYFDTDSVYLNTIEDITLILNQYVQDWAKSYGKDSIDLKFEYEGYFEDLFVLGRCHYVGYDKDGKKEIKGVEIKRTSSTKYESWFQEELIDRIVRKKEDKFKILEWIENEKERIKTLPLLEVAFPARIGTREYKTLTIFMRALQNTKKLYPKFEITSGERFYYIHIKGSGNNVLAFREEDNFINKKNVNYQEVIRRNIDNKMQNIFEILNWNIVNSKQHSLF